MVIRVGESRDGLRLITTERMQSNGDNSTAMRNDKISEGNYHKTMDPLCFSLCSEAQNTN